MISSRDISQRHWNLSDKGEREHDRENQFIDDVIQKSHIERELLSRLEGIKTVFDAGAGAGRFSILLAQKGIQVTHFDISQPMIDKARALAKEAGVENKIHFVKGALEDLADFKGKSYDMVISFDAPISYTYPNQEAVISNLVRMAKKQILISVSSRLGTLPYFANPNQKNQFIINRDSEDKFIRWCVDNEDKNLKEFSYNKEFNNKVMETGLCDDPDDLIRRFESGQAPWPQVYLFMPDELNAILEKLKLTDIELAGPGAYARMLPREILMKIFKDEGQKKDFLDFSYSFDKQASVCGLGKDNLLAFGKIE